VTPAAVPVVQAYQPAAQAVAAVPFHAAPLAEAPHPPPMVAPVAAAPVQFAPQPAAPPPAIDPGFAAWAPLAPAAAQAPPPASSPFAAPPPSPFVTTATAMAAEPMLPESTSGQIRQLELRAIFGVERELSADEILQRLRGLSGIRNVVRVGHEELAAFENLRRCLGGLAPVGAPMRLMFGNSPVELVREGRVVLAVITDGSFAPGVRETIMIGAREIDRLG
jgi:hypothetical protein